MTVALAVLGIVAVVLGADLVACYLIGRRLRGLRLDGERTTRARFLGGRR